MKIDVYDSYAQSSKGHLIHFDVLVEESVSKEKAFEYGQSWLKKIGEIPENLDQSRCNYCHTEQASPEVLNHIKEDGYYILQMEGCPDPIN